jgi:hypothetical protein
MASITPASSLALSVGENKTFNLKDRTLLKLLQDMLSMFLSSFVLKTARA